MKSKKFNIIGIGELLWDMLPTGKELGGAPVNFVYHTSYFGANSTIISAVGNDKLGEELCSVLDRKKIEFSINTVDKPTGTVSVKLNNGIPSYIIHENVAWDFIQLKKEFIEALKNADAICFGTLAQRSKESYNTINQAIKLVPNTALKVFDINFREPFYNQEIIESSLKLANVFKLNDEELIILSTMFNLKGTQEELCKQLMNLFSLKFLALTNGSKGSLLFTASEISKLSVPKIKVVDTVGAGDSFTAAMIIGLLNKKPLKIIHEQAVAHAAKVCLSKGATPNFL